MTNEEKRLLETLQGMDRYIALSLWPPIGDTVIRRTGNRVFINEGRGGKFDDISEAFYGEMVEQFDSRTVKTN